MPQQTAPAAAPPKARTIRDYIQQEATKHGIPPALALALVQTESAGKQSATSRVGARGFFQLMPETAKELGVDPEDPFDNIRGGLQYFKRQLDTHKGDVRLALAAYNAGPGRTASGQVPQIPETQDYVLKVLKQWQSGGASDVPLGGGQAAQATPLPPGATSPTMLGQSTIAGDPAVPAAAPAPGGLPTPDQLLSTAGNVMGGARAQLARTVYGGGDLLRRGLGMERVIDQPNVQAAMTPPEGTAGAVGQFGMEMAEFALPASIITKGRKALQITAKLVANGVTPTRARAVAALAEGVGQGSAAGGISLLHGDDPTAAAVVSAAAPVAATMITQMAPAIRKAAITRMARFFERGMSGDVTPELQRSLAQAAKDFIDLPLQRTWRQTKELTGTRRIGAGKMLQSGLAGPLGDIPVAKQPVVDALDTLVTDAAQHLANVPGGYRLATYRPEIVGAVEELKGILDQYGDMLPARQLHDIKETWWKAVYPRKEASQPVGAVRELLSTAQKEAHMRGAKAIAQVLEQNAPQIAMLDDAVSHAIKLDQFTKRLATKARTGTLAKPAAKYAIGAVGGAAGMGVGSAVGHPIIGAHIGYATARMLLSAIESPKWRLIPIAARRSIADALARGDVERARTLILPIGLAATADQDNLLSPSNSASAAR